MHITIRPLPAACALRTEHTIEIARHDHKYALSKQADDHANGWHAVATQMYI
jgi:hypothetical protein